MTATTASKINPVGNSGNLTTVKKDILAGPGKNSVCVVSLCIVPAMVLFLMCSLVFVRDSVACSSYLVTPGATVDGAAMLTYSADSVDLYGELYYRPARIFREDTLIDVFDWETGKRRGPVRQPAMRTAAVLGNMNEYQVAISESTFGGRKELENPDGAIDYGSLIYLALERAQTARQAIQIIAALAEEVGYVDEGESFGISDPHEVWLMELVGKGPKSKGVLWVARRIPDGYVSVHSNAARIRKFPLHDAQNCLYAPDVISFARQRGWFSGRDEDFEFADTYSPLTFQLQRYGALRPWSLFRRIAPTQKLPLDFVQGIEGAEPLPLWIKPDQRLSARDMMNLMRDHFEGTEFDLSEGMAAGPFRLPYRPRPPAWKVDGSKYFNDRAVSVQQTGFSFVAVSRAFLPNAIGGLLWFGVDDSYSSVYVPMYVGILEVPYSYRVGTASFQKFSWDSAFWVFNVLANWAYTRYSDMIPEIRRRQQELEGEFLAAQSDVEASALKRYAQNPGDALTFLTEYSARQAKYTVTEWRALWERLFLQYLDGNRRDELGGIHEPGFPLPWSRRIVKEAGDRLRVKPFRAEPTD